ncbi:MAG: phosphoenolpyruvate synthase [Lachnospiraceae bacterium]|nr:phosphoenolpyruvate synthase [Lachnospiraceae bacterium]
MAPFERIKSGIPAMDTALDNIRLGDNVVWRVSDLSQFKQFAEPFVRQAIRDGRNLIYVRFAEHEPLFEPMKGLKIVPIELSHRFETFTISIHNLIEKEGFDAFYVFDCLSELEEAWSTDLMMGNFFHLTCPFLFQLDTVAYFPVIRGRHAFDAIAQIRDTTQLFLDVFDAGPGSPAPLFVRPEKVWNRDSATMFLPHLYSPGEGTFSVLSESMQVNRFYHQMNEAALRKDNQNMDSWERFFQLTRLKYENGMDVSTECSRICDIMLTRDDRLRELIKENFTPQDYFDIHARMVGTGMVGGKACGMLLARKLTENLRPDLFDRLEPHDSFYIGSDVFYAYIVYNRFWDLKIRQKTEKGYFTLAPDLADHLMSGKFPPKIEEEFRQLLEYYGSDPVIVRSSSILEDGFGNAFAGKYESVFCGSTGRPEKRLKEFENAIRTVYASTMGLSALDYRKRRGLQDRDEQMALLVQRVSGSRYDRFYMPSAAGVGYSMSPYRMGEARPEEGMLRLVGGLGTAAVDRRTGSYPRVVSLDNPEKTLSTSSSDRHKFSQRLVDVIRDDAVIPLQNFDSELVRKALPPHQTRCLYSHDWDTERIFRERGEPRDIFYLSCDGLVRNKALMTDMKDLLKLLQTSYDYPVDIEYTINISPEGDYNIALLQCRPLQLTKDGEAVAVPENIPDAEVLMETKGASMGFSRKISPDRIVYIDPIAYYNMPYREKPKIKTVLSTINWACRGKDLQLLLLTPGRICTSSPELGVPSAFSDISEFSGIFEISESRAGYMPELSYGSHIFQDLVEAGILYTAVFETASTLRFFPEKLTALPNHLGEYIEDDSEFRDIVRVCSGEDLSLTLYYDMATEHLLMTCRK